MSARNRELLGLLPVSLLVTAGFTSVLIALLDGFWLDMCVDPKRFSRAKTCAVCWEWLETFIRGS